MRIKLSIPSGLGPVDLSQYTGTSDNSFDGVKFYVNEDIESADAWFVIDGIVGEHESCLTPGGDVGFLSGENIFSPNHFLRNERQDFLAQFDTIHSCHPTLLKNAKFAPPFLPWMVNEIIGSVFVPHDRDLAFLQSLEKPPKTRPVSVFCSTASVTPEHQLRLAFVEKLSAHFGSYLDWFGNGVNPLPEKWDGLYPYQASIVLENRITPGMFTEKIFDPLLTWTVPLYWGAPDIQNYFPLVDDQILDLRDFAAAIRKIEDVLARADSETFLENLRGGRNLVMGPRHFLRRISKIAKDNRALSAKAVKLERAEVVSESYFAMKRRPEILLRQVKNGLAALRRLR